MNKLDRKARCNVLRLLCAGQSIRAISGAAGISKNTVAKLLSDAGEVCAEFQDRELRRIPSRRIQVKDIWTFSYGVQKSLPTDKGPTEGTSDTWTWAAIDADTKLVVSWLVGGRGSRYAMMLFHDTSERLINRVQLTHDGDKAYLEAAEGPLSGDIDYEMLTKLYGNALETSKDCYTLAAGIGVPETEIEGRPNSEDIRTFDDTRPSIAARMHEPRLTHLTTGLSKKVWQHASSIALHFMYHNFINVHSLPRVTPAMATGVTDKFWKICDIVEMIEKKEAQKRGSYLKRERTSN